MWDYFLSLRLRYLTPLLVLSSLLPWNESLARSSDHYIFIIVTPFAASYCICDTSVLRFSFFVLGLEELLTYPFPGLDLCCPTYVGGPQPLVLKLDRLRFIALPAQWTYWSAPF